MLIIIKCVWFIHWHRVNALNERDVSLQREARLTTDKVETILGKHVKRVFNVLTSRIFNQ